MYMADPSGCSNMEQCVRLCLKACSQHHLNTGNSLSLRLCNLFEGTLHAFDHGVQRGE